MSGNWKKDLDDPNAEVKNELKKRRLYLLAFAFFPAFNEIIGGVEEVLFRLLHINPYGTAPMMIRHGSLSARRGSGF